MEHPESNPCLEELENMRFRNNEYGRVANRYSLNKLKDVVFDPLVYSLDKPLDTASIPYLFYKDISGSESDQPEIIEERSKLMQGYLPRIFSKVRNRCTGDTVGVIMQKINGRTLDEILCDGDARIKFGKRIVSDLEDIRRLFKLYNTGHGDIALRNIMVDETGKVYLIDLRREYDVDMECAFLDSVIESLNSYQK